MREGAVWEKWGDCDGWGMEGEEWRGGDGKD